MPAKRAETTALSMFAMLKAFARGDHIAQLAERIVGSKKNVPVEAVSPEVQRQPHSLYPRDEATEGSNV